MREQKLKLADSTKAEHESSFSQERMPFLTNSLSPAADRTHQILHMWRTIGNQASLRLLRKPMTAPLPIRQTMPKGYVKRAVIQRHIMPYDTWKDYSDVGTFSMRPDDLKPSMAS